MSAAISVFNYEFQGQVLSPAFSPPPSPPSDAESVDSVEGDDTKRVAKKRKMSQSPHQSSAPQFVNKKPKFPTKYHEMLQPLSPVTTLPFRPAQQPFAVQMSTEVNVQLQEEFLKLMRHSDVEKIETFLKQHSENIDINRFNTDGQTPIHEACQSRDIACVRALLRYGANPCLATRDGFSILHLASFSGSSELLSFVSGLRRPS